MAPHDLLQVSGKAQVTAHRPPITRMARTYKRDSIGRFSGGGGGGGKKGGASGGTKKAASNTAPSGGGGKTKAATSRATNKARAGDLASKGTSGLGSRVKVKGFAGGKAAQQRAGGLRAAGTAAGGGIANTVGRGGKMSAAQRSATTAANRRSNAAASRATNKGGKPARTNKSPVSAAKAKYKELSGQSRKRSPLRSAAENRTAAGASRSLKSMIAKRGAASAPKKRPILDAIARPIVRAMAKRSKKR